MCSIEHAILRCLEWTSVLGGLYRGIGPPRTAERPRHGSWRCTHSTKKKKGGHKNFMVTRINNEIQLKKINTTLRFQRI